MIRRNVSVVARGPDEGLASKIPTMIAFPIVSRHSWSHSRISAEVSDDPLQSVALSGAPINWIHE